MKRLFGGTWDKRLLAALGVALACSMTVTVGLIALDGRWQEALPLHLCSISALLALAAAFGARGTALDFLWYLGMPGALLALVFPAPALSRFQALLNASYVTTHALILVIPIVVMMLGTWPRAGRSPVMFMILQGIALVAYGANRMLKTDFLFLMAPPAGTPLVWVFSWGYPAYLMVLEVLMLFTCMAMDALLTHFCAGRQK